VYVAQLTIIQIIIAAHVRVYIYVAQQTIIIQITAAPGGVSCATIIMVIIIRHYSLEASNALFSCPEIVGPLGVTRMREI
jgi:hypothetical protein